MNNFIKTVFFDIGMTLVTSDTTKWNPGAQAVLAELRAEGLRLGIISNTEGLTRADLQARLPPDFDFGFFEADLLLLSSEVGIKKPNLGIFNTAVSRAGTPAAQCLYCSEDLVETLAAQRVGMKAARIQPPPSNDLTRLVEAIRAAAALK